MSLVRGPDGSPCTVTSRYVAFSFDLHSAVSKPGTLTHGVSMGRSGTTQGFLGLTPTIVRPSAAKYACRFPVPPARAAGFVHPASMSVAATLPKRVFAGGGTVERNDAYVITQPDCVAEWHKGTCWNEPPTSFPRGTARLTPNRTAETILDCTGLPSISLRMSSSKMNEP